MGHHFPNDISGLNRREFLGLMAASAALAGGVACRRPEVPALPYTKAPERLLPGVPLHYATSVERAGGDPIGVIVTCHEGRPIKIEGNPDHPASLGAVDPVTQAMILELYDPDRSQKVFHNGQPSTLEEFEQFAGEHFKALRSSQGAGLAFLSEATSSPTLRAQRERILKEIFPKATWHVWEPVNDDHEQAGLKMALSGKPLRPSYALERAKLILALDCDFLGQGPRRLALARAFTRRRRPENPQDGTLRLYVAESGWSLTGAAADHRIALAPIRLAALLQAVHDRVMLHPPKNAPPPPEVDPRWFNALVRDLLASPAQLIFLAGPHLSPAVHAATCILNVSLGGGCVAFHETDDHDFTNRLDSISDLVSAIGQGRVQTLVILGGNPACDAPADLDFRKVMAQVKTSIQLSLYPNETARLCDWNIPRAHALEAWGDTQTTDGVISLAQPLIAPLYGGLAETELLARIAGDAQNRAFDIVRAYQQKMNPEGFEAAWRKALHDGVGARREAVRELNPQRIMSFGWMKVLWDEAQQPAAQAGVGDFQLLLRPHSYLHDGRFANNGWLQETPEPITKLSWDNAALLSPKAAQRLNVSNGDAVKIESQGRAIELPVWIVPGMDDATVLVHLGYGRTAAGRVGNGRGVDAYPLLTAQYLKGARAARLTPTGRRLPLATMQEHGEQGGRELVREASSSSLVPPASKSPDPQGVEPLNPNTNRHGEEDPALWRAPLDPSQDPQWAMAIDLSACIGCHACVLACQAENNIPIVGKEQIANGRIMQWLRVDRYFKTENQKTEIVFQPLPCQQCETAPCEQVCPFSATTHSPEGLNEMTYNRCVGTRYCSNNCPFKVRRFNFFNYHKDMTAVEKMGMNPDVTVRMRGVMEKCNYCVQRITRARVAAKGEGRAIRDGEIRTACQQACPTDAIVFGNQADPASAVAKLKKNPRNYVLLEDVNLRPRTSYLEKARNLNPELK